MALQDVPVLHAEKAVLVKETVVSRCPVEVNLRRHPKEFDAPQRNAVADPDDVAEVVSIREIVFGQWPRRANVVVLEKLVVPGLRIDDEAIGMDQNDVVGVDVAVQIEYHKLAPFADTAERLDGDVLVGAGAGLGVVVGEEQHPVEGQVAGAVLQRLGSGIDLGSRHRHQSDVANVFHWVYAAEPTERTFTNFLRSRSVPSVGT